MALPLAALILAAGSGTRMGRLKQLLPLGNKPVIRHSVDTVSEAGAAEVIVVCGGDPEKYQAALIGTRAQLVPNRKASSEMADSIRLGLGQLDPARFSGILVCLADHPLVRPETCITLLRVFEQHAAEKVVIPAYRGKRGHPALFPSRIIDEIFSKTSLRDIIRGDASRVIVLEVPDEGVALDMDTQQDYQRALGLYQARLDSKGAYQEKTTRSGEDHV